tara:strand:- start:130 stop:699 length:570 start_codon:yes stop_codon:yes gene_type:complete
MKKMKEILRNTSIFMITVFLASCGGSTMQCNDVEVTDLVSELAIDLYNEENDQIFVQGACNAFTNSMLALQGIDCSALQGSFVSEVLYPDSVIVSAVRTTSTTESGIQNCAANLEFVFNERDIAGLVKNYYSKASTNNDIKTSMTDSMTTAMAAFMPTTKTTSGVYDVQLTDDGDNFYVNLELAEVPQL